MADPVNYITHQTGYWALFMLLASLAVTPVRRLHPKLANLIRFRRLLGLYAFFYATLHLATYVFLFSGYDVPTVWAGLKAGHLGVVVEQWKLVWPTVLDDLKKRRFIQVGLFGWVLLFAAGGDVSCVCDALDGRQGVAAAALFGVCGGDGRMCALLVAGEEGRKSTAAVYAGADGAAAGAGGLEHQGQSGGEREKQAGSGARR